MNRELFLAMLFVSVLIGALGLSFKVQRVEASGTIYVRADGSIDPPTAPISTVDNVTYILTGNITSDADGIVIERNNTVIDGAGYTLQGTGNGTGMTFSGRSNVTIKNTEITTFDYGIELDSSSNITISGNRIANNTQGIWLDGSSNNNTILRNNITANSNYGIYFEDSSNNSIYHNNFVNNAHQVYDFWAIFGGPFSINAWDNGYPSGGNYWSDYNGADADHDGIGDTAHVIDANNTDHYPLMVPTVIPEFPMFSILPFFMTATLLAVVVYTGKKDK